MNWAALFLSSCRSVRKYCFNAGPLPEFCLAVETGMCRAGRGQGLIMDMPGQFECRLDHAPIQFGGLAAIEKYMVDIWTLQEQALQIVRLDTIVFYIGVETALAYAAMYDIP